MHQSDSDHDRVNQRVIELLIEKLGWQAVVVADGESAVEVATLEQLGRGTHGLPNARDGRA